MVESLRPSRARAYESARADVQALVPRTARRILELGCSSGRLGAALKARQGAEVIGIEVDPRYAAEADVRLDRVFRLDLDDAHLLERTRPEFGRYDSLIAADVLEHLRDPWTTLYQTVRGLEVGGSAIISLPNVRSWRTFVEVFVRGRWPRNDTGIFDRTHLRWFTLADIRELVAYAGLDLVHVSPQYWLSGRRGRLLKPLTHTPVERFLPAQYIVRAVRRA